MQNQLGQLKANPAKFLASRQLNIPQGISSPKQMIESITGVQIPDEYANNPSGYMNYLISNVQIPQQQQNQIVNFMNMFGM